MKKVQKNQIEITDKRTLTLTVHKFRRTARKQERLLQRWLDFNYGNPNIENLLEKDGYPKWMRGARVEKAGPFQYSVIATSFRGH
jgi:hypothetical protein